MNNLGKAIITGLAASNLIACQSPTEKLVDKLKTAPENQECAALLHMSSLAIQTATANIIDWNLHIYRATTTDDNPKFWGITTMNIELVDTNLNWEPNFLKSIINDPNWEVLLRFPENWEYLEINKENFPLYDKHVKIMKDTNKGLGKINFTEGCDTSDDIMRNIIQRGQEFQ